MRLPILLLFSLLQFSFLQCQQKATTVDIETPPVFSEADQQYKDIFKSLDGTWKGQFLIYEDTKRKKAKQVNLKNISKNNLDNTHLKQVGNIAVTQVYTSESPYFQKVTITDFYPDKNQKVVSKGVNKVENGKMLCIVKKPDEIVIHDGYIDNDNHTIIWHRTETTPQKIEFFRETVLEKTYEIIGWGYYEGDDVKLSPRLWFYGKYVRQ